MDNPPKSSIAAGRHADSLFVTRPDLPELSDLIPLLKGVWSRRVLTNGGPLHQQLESALAEHLGVRHISLFNNGMIALMTALRCLGLSGEVITTPFSFVATANALIWSGLEPVFVDIDRRSLNLDPAKIEAAITPRTSAILPVHCYGNPCDVDAIEEIAARRGIRVVYDAAHAFGVNCHCGSVLAHGDMSVLSFHATKVFNTFEGGAVVSASAELKAQVDRWKNFGIADEVSVSVPGTNGKMNELQAAIGLLQLKRVDESIARRAAIDLRYRSAFTSVPGIEPVREVGQVRSNYSYFPVLVGSDYPESRDDLYHRMRENHVVARRYFYPLITDFEAYREIPSANRAKLPVATDVADRVLCLPIYPDLTTAEQDRVIELILRR